MTVQNRLRVLTMVFGFVGFVTLSSIRSLAQEPAKSRSPESSKSVSARKGSEPSRRVPQLFGQIGLSPDQKEQIYRIRAKHQEKLDSLEKQIAATRSEMLNECESVLTEGQKKSLEGRRSEGAAKRLKTASPAKAAEPVPN